MKDEWMNRRYLKKYSVVFLFFCAAAFLPFFSAGKSMIWVTDGLPQYFPYLHYIGNYLRDFLEGLFSGKGALKMVDFCLGMGDDVGAVFRSHPLDFLSAAVPGKYTELLYQFLILLRIYLAGLSFSGFCLYWRKTERAALAGSMIYVFCGYVLKMGIRHPTFNAPLIVLPLLLVGAEQVMRGKSVLLFSFMTAMGFLSNYYFMYMCTLALGCYVLVRFFDLYREHRVKNFFFIGMRGILSYLLGVGMAAASLLPTMIRLGTSARLGGETLEDLWLYDNGKRYYLWFLDLISPLRDTGSNTHLNYAVLVLPALVLLFARKWREHLALKAALLAELLVLLIPAGGYVLAGFSNVNNRWCFIVSFTVSFAFVAVEEDFYCISRKQAAGLAALLALFAGLGLYEHFFVKANPYALAALAQLAGCVAILLVMGKYRVPAGRGYPVLLLILVLSTGLNGYFTYSEKYGNVAGEFVDRGGALSYYETSPYTAYSRIQDEDFYRVDSNLVVTGRENTSVLLEYQGISMYNSIINADVLQYLLDQESIGLNALHRVFGLDGRTVPEALANVKYYLVPEGEEQNVPYGFALDEKASDSEYKIYRNEYPLSLGYTYDTVLKREDYEKLNALEKQQAMLDGAVVEEDAGLLNLAETAGENTGVLTVPVELPESGKDLKRKEDGYSVKKAEGSITIPYQRRAGYECYLRLIGLERNKSYCSVDIAASDLYKSVTVREKNGTYSLGRDNYTVNLGYSDRDAQEEITVIFREKGTYRLAGVQLCYVPMDGYEEKIGKLNQESLENVSVETNGISGRVHLLGDRYMVFSIPYSQGWTAYVDGVKTELQKANVMYLGLPLSAGEHEIVLTYCTPGIKAGAVIALASCFIFFLLLFRWLKKLYKRKDI